MRILPLGGRAYSDGGRNGASAAIYAAGKRTRAGEPPVGLFLGFQEA
jgi:hypothetical protein